MGIKNLGVKVSHLQGQGAREYQEDSFAIVNSRNIFKRQKQGLFAIVCDGMGGLDGGKHSSEYAVKQMCFAFQNLNFSQNIGNQLAFYANETSKNLAEDAKTLCGTTMVAVHIFGNMLNYVSVGDSAILLNRDGFLIELNEEHILFNELLEAEIESDEICVENAREFQIASHLTSFVGMGELEKIDFTQKAISLKPNDKILLCSDGVSKVLSESKISQALELSPEQAAKVIHSEISNKNHANQDNFTAIVIQVRE